MKMLSKAVVGLLLLGCTSNVSQADMLTSQAIFGSGNSRTLFNVVQNDGVEIGLRAKVRGSNDDSIGGENTPQSVYYIDHVVDPSNSAFASWNLDWSVNTNFDGSGDVLSGYSYSLSFDFEPTSGSPASSAAFDPLTHFPRSYDNSYGYNNTPQGGGTEPSLFGISASDLRDSRNVAQNSFNVGFDYFIAPPVFPLSVIEQTGVYTIILSVFDENDIEVASNQIEVYAGVQPPAAVPEPTSIAILGMGALGLAGGGLARRRLKKNRESANS